MELLAPAGNLEKLQIALHYGADAVYLGLADFSLRSLGRGFDEGTLVEGLTLARSAGRRAYCTLNILPHDRDLPALEAHLRFLSSHHPDAIIVSDPGVFEMVRDILPETDIHISTQANVTNPASARFWQRLGAKRIILAREVSIDEIKRIRDAIDIEIEAFVHGSICIAYSGRCYISSFLSNRSANDGACTNSCRWNYTLMKKAGSAGADTPGTEVTESHVPGDTGSSVGNHIGSDTPETLYLREARRPDEYMPVFEDDRGTYIMSSRDLCMIEHLGALARAGVSSCKIEGRAKGINYVAGVVKAYREAIDALARGEERIDPRWLDELAMFSSRGYTTGMYLGAQPDPDYNHDEARIDRKTHEVAGVVRQFHGRRLHLSPRAVLRPGAVIQFLTAGWEQAPFRVAEIFNMDDEPVPATKNEADAWIVLDDDIPESVRPLDVVRRPACEKD